MAFRVTFTEPDNAGNQQAAATGGHLITTPSTSPWLSWPGRRSGTPPSRARPPRSSPTCRRPGRRSCWPSPTSSASANIDRSSPAPTGWYLSAAPTWSDISNEAKRSSLPWPVTPPAAGRPRRAASAPQQRIVIPVWPRDSRQALDPDPDQGQVRSRTMLGAVMALTIQCPAWRGGPLGRVPVNRSRTEAVGMRITSSGRSGQPWT